MQRIILTLLVSFFVTLTGEILFAQSAVEQQREQERRERRLRQEQEAQKRVEGLFPSGKPPKGTVTVVGRSFVYSVNQGFGNTIALLRGSTDKNVQQELGLNPQQIDRLNVLRNEVQLGLMMQAPKYASRLKTMSDADRESIQKDIMADLQRITDRADEITTPEQKENTKRLVFQATGGLDSPIVNLDSMSSLKLSDEQKKQAETTLKELEQERLASLDDGLKLAEKYFELGGANMTPEQRAAFEAEVKSQQIKSAALGRKVGESLRKLLTDEQRNLEKTLLANRPKFLPALPSAMRGDFSRPDALPLDSWVPGQGAPKERTEEKKSRRPFPTSDTEE